MKETTLTIEQIETLITGYQDSPFYIRSNIVIPNCNWGFLNHEADLLMLSKANRLTEVEIKRTWSDFMADFKKSHTLHLHGGGDRRGHGTHLSSPHQHRVWIIDNG